MKKLFDSAGKYLSLVRFSHTVFAMPFALVGYFLGATTAWFRFQSEDVPAYARLHGFCAQCSHGLQQVCRRAL
ncbi:MAG: hypothetical protein MZV63_62645 [Marinilabiliales bacterium]|nr:hypothetical protein [Marinilabiliales bacterium]